MHDAQVAIFDTQICGTCRNIEVMQEPIYDFGSINCYKHITIYSGLLMKDPKRMDKFVNWNTFPLQIHFTDEKQSLLFQPLINNDQRSFYTWKYEIKHFLTRI